MILTLATEPTAEPITLAEAKTHLRVSTIDEDSYITSLISAARLHTESVTNRALITQTWDLYLDRFPSSPYLSVELPKPKLQSITYIKYTDVNGTLQTWDASNYDVDGDSFLGLVYPVYQGDWPSGVRDHPKAVTIRYVAGYAPSGASSPEDQADNVPMPLKQAILLLVGHLYENREASSQNLNVTSTPMAYESLIASYRVHRF